MGIEDFRLSRRAALGGAGALVIGLSLPVAGRAQGAAKAAAAAIDPNAFVRIGADDVVTVMVKHIEFGQGPFTGLATLVAEELDADWSQMRAEAAPANAAIYGNVSLGGIQGTGGSTAMASSYMLMRQAGATARAMLVAAAAAQWGVPPTQISVAKGVIRHAASGREGRFGSFAAAAAKLPVPGDVPLKRPEQFGLIGKDQGVGKLDSADKVNGKARFTIDIDVPEMLTVVIARPPRFGATVADFDAVETLKVRGVKAVKAVPSGIAVYARGMWPAIKGRNALKVRWNDDAAEKRGSEEMIAQFRDMARKTGRVAANAGDVDAALTVVDGDVIEREYVFPFLAHAPMEPLDAYLEWDGKTALARLGSQIQTLDLGALAATLGLPQEKVRIETMLAGGSFGRRATATAHLAVELAEVGKAIGPGTPVKLVWTREDDIHGGYYRPLFVHRMRGAVKDGKVVAWANDVVGQSFAKGTPFEPMMVRDGVDGAMIEGAREIFYDIPAFRCAVQDDPTPVPTLWWRSVGHTHTGYAVECFIDELLRKAGKDPVAGRLALMKGKARPAGVLRAVADLAKWNGPSVPGGRARGVAVVESFGSFVAQIAEVSLDDNGEPKVHKIWCAVDVGVPVNPDVIRAQVEGGIGYGLGHALYAEVPLVNGAAAVSNFNDYRSLRIMEMPEIEVAIVPSAEPPTGIGEPGVPPIAPAVANALARLGRDRPARLPMVRAA